VTTAIETGSGIAVEVFGKITLFDFSPLLEEAANG
jgi:hypothetical protein